MKKLLAILLAVIMLLSATGLAEELIFDESEESAIYTMDDDHGDFSTDEESVEPGTMIIQVVDAQQKPMQGVPVTLYGLHTGERVIADSALTDENGQIIFTGVEVEGMYAVRATDPTDNYSAEQSVFFSQSMTDLVIVIRKLQEGSLANVGSVTQVSGSFFSEMWGNNTSDIDVRELLHGLPTINWNDMLAYCADTTVVKELQATIDSNGDKTYSFELYDDLYFNDGSPITAVDYAFSVLLQCAPEVIEIGGKAYGFSQIVGHEAYNSGQSDSFAGVHIIDEHKFSLTISGEYLPYFFELAYVRVIPYPISVIAPGCTVVDDGNGATITPILDENGNPLGEFTVDVLRSTILDPETGYLCNPAVSAGPYKLVSFDIATGDVAFTANRYYKGNENGQRPLIENLTLREVENETLLDDVLEERVQLVNKVTDSAIIFEGLEYMRDERINASAYMRTGYGFVNFACEMGVTQYESVRKAITLALDRESFVQDYLAGLGRVVHSYYGLGQWMAQPYDGTLEESLTIYPYSLEMARDLLEEDGWNLNAEGEAFVEGTDAVRYKKLEDGSLMALKVRFAKSINNKASKLVDEAFSANLPALGFDYTCDEIPFEELLEHYYRHNERRYELIYLATNFGFVFDPYYTFHTDDAYQGSMNTSGIRDDELLKLTEIILQTEGGDTELFKERWVDVMARFSEILPTLPIYSNVYYDFFGETLQNYAISSQRSWAIAILYAYMSGF